MSELGKSKVYRMGGEDLLVEAYAPVEGKADEYRRISFKSQLIDYVFEIDDKLSGLVLSNGVTIPVALTFDSLKAAVYEPDFKSGSGIDLTLVTGKAVGDVQAVRLAKTFNPAASAEAPKENKPLQITGFAHPKQSLDMGFKRLSFYDSQIDHFEPSTARPDSETFIQLKTGYSADGLTTFFLPIPLTSFTYLLNQAKQQGQAALDISEMTRPKTTKNLNLSAG